MLTFLPPYISATIGIVFAALNTAFALAQIFPVALLKLIIPVKAWKKFCTGILTAIAGNWVYINNQIIKLITTISWDIKGLDDLKIDDWYLVVPNHQSNLDIIILQKIFHNRIPFLKFFAKSQLRWVPFFGFAWWALDFPFLKRYSKEFIKKNPHLKGKDLEVTKKACKKFKDIPTSIVNFIEGTRFKKHLHEKQKSGLKYLLKPKAGGIGFVISALGERINNILDVTIIYPGEAKGLWDFLCNRVREIKVYIKCIPLEKDLIGDYVSDDVYRQNFQRWLNELWEKKDKEIEKILNG